MTTTSSEREKQPTICIKKITRNEKKGKESNYSTTTRRYMYEELVCVLYINQERRRRRAKETQKNQQHLDLLVLVRWCGKEATLDAGAPPPSHEYSSVVVTLRLIVICLFALALHKVAVRLCWCAGQTMARAVQKRQPRARTTTKMMHILCGGFY